eukprot:m.81852 g.81852  ORF g.81852 m.81852 type:complete len:166 (+) comp12070_c0_seq3:725-1222(+)
MLARPSSFFFLRLSVKMLLKNKRFICASKTLHFMFLCCSCVWYWSNAILHDADRIELHQIIMENSNLANMVKGKAGKSNQKITQFSASTTTTMSEGDVTTRKPQLLAAISSSTPEDDASEQKQETMDNQQGRGGKRTSTHSHEEGENEPKKPPEGDVDVDAKYNQ